MRSWQARSDWKFITFRAFYRRFPLYIRAILFVVLVCMTMLALDLRQSWIARDVRLQQATTETGNLADSLAQHALDVFENTDSFLKVLRSALLDEAADPAAVLRVERRMRTRVAGQNLIGRLFLFDSHGSWLASSLDPSDFARVSSLNYADRDYFRYHRDHDDDRVLIGPPIEVKLDGSSVVTVSRRLNHPDGGFAGVIGASINIGAFQRYFETFDIGKQGAITLTDGLGTVLIRRPFDQNNVGRNVARSQFFQEIQDNADSGSIEFASLIDGRPRLGSFHRVPGFGLIMIVALDKQEVLASWWEDMQIHLVWLTIIVMFVALLGYRMTLQIRYRGAAEARLGTSGETLERRVEERTADLQQMVGQRDLLLREVYHRVKNNMQVVDGLLAMEVKHLDDAEARQPLLDIRSRVHALGLAHQQLMGSADLETFDIAPFLRELAGNILENAGDRAPGLSVEVIPLMVTLDFAIPMGLILSELVTGCLNHVFPPGNGRITVRLHQDAANIIVLTVSDNGLSPTLPIYPDLRKAARRTKFIKGLVGQIDGTMNVCYDNGSHTEIVFENQGLSK